MKDTEKKSWVYYVAIFLVKIWYAIMFKVEIIGKENIPETGNGVICSNHYSNYDPVSTAIYLDRLPHYIAKKELFKNKLFSWVLDQLGVFPIDRKVSMDMKAVKTAIKLFKEGKIVGIFAVADVLKPTSRAAVEALRSMHIDVTLLTGDNKKTAQSIASELGVTDVIAEVLPQDKEHIVREKQGKDRKVAMIGDGINDAPALARADVGIAIGAGTDVAISSADVVLMKSDLMDAVDAIRLSRRTMRNIRQNLFWAFFYNCIGIPIAAGLLWVPFGIKLSPMIGAAAMSLSSVCVVSNALRLRFFSATPRKTAGTPAVLPISGEKPLTAHKKEENVMEKTIKVEGMMCQHCVAHVKKALEGAAAGCDVAVDLDAGKAVVSGKTLPEDAVLTAAVTEAGYKVVGIE